MADLVPEVVPVESEDDLDAQADAIAQSNAWGHPQTCPLHIAILKGPSGAIRMVWTAHHALIDAWSMSITRSRVASAYAASGPAREASLPSPGFAQVARYLAARDHAADRAFWATYLSGAEPLQLLSAARENKERQAIDATHLGSVNLSKLAKQVHTPPSTIFLFALAMGLRLLTDQEDISFGLLLSGRTLPIAGIESIIGPCINTTICRVALNDSHTVQTALMDFQANLDEVNERGYLGLNDLAGAAKVDSSSIVNALAEYRNLPSTDDSNNSAKALDIFHDSDLTGDDRANAPLMVSGGPDPAGGLRISASTNTSVMSKDDAQWLLRHICNILAWMERTGGQEPLQQLNILDDAQLDKIMEWSLAPEAQALAEQSNTPELLHQLIEAQVDRTPRKVAIHCEHDEFLTFEQLNSRAEQ
ncbi:hypothetical protein OC842_007994, partial [Tilletia horrida]